MPHHCRLRSRLLAGWLVFSAAAAQGTELTAAADLRAEAERASRHGAPLIILFSRRDCGYCETVRRDYLQALERNPRYRDRVVVRQVNQDSAAPLLGFAAETTSQAAFAEREKIRLVPVVAFYGPRGRHLAEPIVGTRLPDFYQGYLEDAIEQAGRALKSR